MVFPPGFDPLSDPITAAALAWKLINNMQQAPEDFADIYTQTRLMATCLDKLRDIRDQQALTPLEQFGMATCVNEAKKVLKDMGKLLKRTLVKQQWQVHEHNGRIAHENVLKVRAQELRDKKKQTPWVAFSDRVSLEEPLSMDAVLQNPKLRAQFWTPKVIAEGRDVDDLDADSMNDDALAVRKSNDADESLVGSQNSWDIIRWRSRVPPPVYSALPCEEIFDGPPTTNSNSASKKPFHEEGLLLFPDIVAAKLVEADVVKLVGLMVVCHGLFVLWSAMKHPVRTYNESREVRRQRKLLKDLS